jgi:Na+-translocating ferredoxin:NAD+ oxidoreductase RnfG subunit
MDNEAQVKIIIAVIGLIGTVIGAVLGYISKSKKQAIEDAKREQQQNDQFNKIFEEMNIIKKKLDEHNHYAEKFGEIEKSIIAIKKDIEYIRKEK